MVRVKKGVNALKSRRNLLKQAKGFRNGRKNKERMANEQLVHSYTAAFTHRRDKKGDFRRLWNIKINASLRPLGYSYSKFIGAMKVKGYEVDRKILADLAQNSPEAFNRIVSQVMAA
jgi:large subunit ribosomal protein L20